MPNINLIYYLIAGGVFGALALKTGIPAAPLAGALIGASILSISGKVNMAEWPIGTRTILEIGIGTVIGTSLTKDALNDLQSSGLLDAKIIGQAKEPDPKIQIFVN